MKRLSTLGYGPVAICYTRGKGDEKYLQICIRTRTTMKRRIIHTPTPRIGGEKKRTPHRLIGRTPKIGMTTTRIREKRIFPWRPIFRIILVSTVVAAVVWAMYSSLFTVKTIAIEGTANVSKDVIEKQIPQNQNLWRFPAGTLESSIRRSSPYIADVAIYRGIPNAVRVVVVERTLAIDWQSNGKHFLLGLDGTVVAASDPPTPLLVIVDKQNIEPTVGQAVVTPGFVQFAVSLGSSFESAIGVHLKQLEIGETTFDVTAIPETGPRIIVESSRGAAVQLKAAKEVMDQFKDGIKEYIDMRVPGKAYFK